MHVEEFEGPTREEHYAILPTSQLCTCCKVYGCFLAADFLFKKDLLVSTTIPGTAGIPIAPSSQDLEGPGSCAGRRRSFFNGPLHLSSSLSPAHSCSVRVATRPGPSGNCRQSPEGYDDGIIPRQQQSNDVLKECNPSRAPS